MSATTVPPAPPVAPSSSAVAPTAKLLSYWERLHTLPGGKRLFSWLVGRMAPYTRTIRGLVTELSPGHARVELRDRPHLRNHLRSIHAMALANLAEKASGLAVVSALPADARGILVGFRIEYLKKARGTLVAECTCEVPTPREPMDFEPEVVVRDAAGDVVVKAWPTWRLAPLR